MRVYLDNCMFNRPFDDQSHKSNGLHQGTSTWQTSLILKFALMESML